MSGLCVIRRPINTDERKWWEKLTGVPFVPLYNGPSPEQVFYIASRHNRKNLHKWRCTIGRVVLK